MKVNRTGRGAKRLRKGACASSVVQNAQFLAYVKGCEPEKEPLGQLNYELGDVGSGSFQPPPVALFHARLGTVYSFHTRKPSLRYFEWAKCHWC